ncbi:MAG TPA: UTP--glucose-1-phosphate uridylyltransferase [Candidatus Borkfalkia avistercoris]|uniref:UTP--glucose-1-phosphate uridylyltransferase n=1 Tax=Candidatus Borkfalkia avistercoris TaxID=2838504 RepID=A0A9D2IDZ4_9FIRM|nr:UTP--glucose-1-phosphate uridylyltransferase [Candidatus Borkfalkia avistercoris]
MKKVKKAVIPAAGYGTRFLPITKAVCKEMLPIVDKPTLQYIVEEAVAAGIREILIVTGRNKKNIEDFFDYTPELDSVLEDNRQEDFLKLSREMENLADIYFVRQKHPVGFADAVMYAKPFTGDGPFAILLGDDIIYTEPKMRPGIRQLADEFEKSGKTTVALMNVADADIPKYANVKASALSERLFEIEKIVEKPKIEDKFSNDAVIGRYVVDAGIYDVISHTPPSPKGEVYFTDALGLLAAQGLLHGYRFEGIRYDAGNKLDYLKANIEFALRDAALQKGLADYIKKLAGKL